jgi:hypothetical protein
MSALLQAICCCMARRVVVVQGRASGPSRSRVDDGGGLQYVSRKIDWVLGFSRRGEYIGGRAASGGGPGQLTPWWHGPGLGRAALGCG